jgi:hypothetical protein
LFRCDITIVRWADDLHLQIWAGSWGVTALMGGSGSRRSIDSHHILKDQRGDADS